MSVERCGGGGGGGVRASAREALRAQRARKDLSSFSKIALFVLVAGLPYARYMRPKGAVNHRALAGGMAAAAARGCGDREARHRGRRRGRRPFTLYSGCTFHSAFYSMS
jgi:hypothetical protein